jgi:hypothetical protein
MTLVRLVTGTQAVGESINVPLPSCPLPFEPIANTLPASVTNKEWADPVAIIGRVAPTCDGATALQIRTNATITRSSIAGPWMPAFVGGAAMKITDPGATGGD